MSVKNDVIAVGVVGVVLFAAAWWAKKQLPNMNPVDEKNVVNQLALDWYRKATGSTGTIGTDIYGYWNPSPDEAQLRELPGAGMAVDFYQWLTNSEGNQIMDWKDGTLFRGAFNPISDNNIAYRAVSALGGGSFTGPTEWTLGTKIYDWTH